MPGIAALVRAVDVYVREGTLIYPRNAQYYHCILTFDDEVSRIWPEPTWKMGKILFLGTRYTALIHTVPTLIRKQLVDAKAYPPNSTLTEVSNASQLAS